MKKDCTVRLRRWRANPKKPPRKKSGAFVYKVKVSKVDYGLFRASRSHNPAHNSCSMGPLPHYALIVGRVNTPFSHCKQACVGDGLLTL